LSTATVPSCIVCGAKFSHDNENKCCRKCGVPDIILHDAALRAQWKSGKLDLQAQPKIEFKRPGAAGSRHRKKRKHGRSR